MKTSHPISYSKLETIRFNSEAILNCALNSLLSNIILESLAGSQRQKNDILKSKKKKKLKLFLRYGYVYIGDPQNAVIKLLEVINNLINAISIYKTG